jgi:hypothetical protein
MQITGIHGDTAPWLQRIIVGLRNTPQGMFSG